jgi:hypothetical protein
MDAASIFRPGNLGEGLQSRNLSGIHYDESGAISAVNC